MAAGCLRDDAAGAPVKAERALALWRPPVAGSQRLRADFVDRARQQSSFAHLFPQLTLDINLTSGFLGVKYQVPAMLERGGGSLISTSPFVGTTVGFPGMATCAASKAGLNGLAQVLAAEFGKGGVRANVLLPSGIDTPSNAANGPEAGPETRAFIERLHALKRLGTSQELAQAAPYLTSDASSFMTGTTIMVDGGVSINRTLMRSQPGLSASFIP